MTTIKVYTDIEQSKKLAEILPIESADMCWCLATKGDSKAVFNEGYNKYGDFELPCWSLSALLNILPTLNGRNAILCKDISCDKWHICYHSTAILSIIDTKRYDNIVDACMEMIIHLNELNLL